MNSKFESFGDQGILSIPELGDARRTCRLVKTADLMPDQAATGRNVCRRSFTTPKILRAFYPR